MKRPPRRRPAVPALAAAALLAAAPALAASRASVAPPCAAAPGDAPAAVVAITDDLDLALADGRILRLAGIDPPQATEASPDLPARARRALEGWLGGGTGPAILHPLAPVPDRWGRIPALLFRPAPSGVAPSAADALLRAGLARVRVEAAAVACAPAALAAEAAARDARLGLWADPHYALLGPSDAEGLAGQAGGMALVQGVLHVHEARGALYLALGRDRRGFVALVSRRDAARFAKAGFDLRDYDGSPVRLRGDLDARFGPRLRVTDPAAVESLEPGSLAEAGEPPKHWTEGAGTR